jgi:hypothetical protein
MILRKRATALRSLWDQVLEIANQGALPRPVLLSNALSGQESYCPPQVKHVVKLMRALRGTAISEEGSSVLQILEVSRHFLPPSPPSLDLSTGHQQEGTQQRFLWT